MKNKKTTVTKINKKNNQVSSLREAFGKSLSELAHSNRDIVVIDADVSNSTKTSIFAQEHPDRFFNVGVSEQDMVSISAGMAACGKIPVVVSFGVFIVGRALDQIRNMILHCNLNVKLIGSHAGLSPSADGATHQALEDISIMRSLPGVRVISPSDAIETKAAIKYAIETIGPVYLRIPREKEEIIHNDDYVFNPDKIEVIEEFKGRKVAIIATGTMVSRAINAACVLKRKDIKVGVINVHTIKPLDQVTVKSIAYEVDLIITIEDHNIIGGLGAAIAETIAEINSRAILRRFGVKDVFGESGKISDLYDKHGLTTKKIVDEIIKLINEFGLMKYNADNEIQQRIQEKGHSC